MKVSVIIPIFDIGPLLSDTILSVIDQSFTVAGKAGRVSLHLIFDGCPLHETNRAIIDDAVMGSGQCDITVSYGENGGVSNARNIGIDRILADQDAPEFVILFDADDLMPPNYIQTCTSHFIAKKDEIANLGWVYVDQIGFGKSNYVLRYPNAFDPCRFTISNLSQPTSLISIDLLRAGIRFDENLEAGLEDYEFWLQAVIAGFVGAYCSETYCHYRVLSGSRSSVNRANDDYTRNYIMAKHKPFFGAKALMAQSRAAIPSFLRWNSHRKTFQDTILGIGPDTRIRYKERNINDLRSGFFERMFFHNKGFDEFYEPRLSRYLSIGSYLDDLREEAVLDSFLQIEELLLKANIVRLVFPQKEMQAPRVIGYFIKTRWVQDYLSDALRKGQRTFQLLLDMSERLMKSEDPQFSDFDIEPFLKDPNRPPAGPTDMTRLLFDAFDTLIGEGITNVPQPKLRLCAVPRANFKEIFNSVLGTFPVVSAFGENEATGIGVVFDDPENKNLVQGVLDHLPRSQTHLFWFGEGSAPAVTGASDMFHLDCSNVTWNANRRYVGAKIEPPKALLERIRSRILGLDRIVVVGNSELFVCLAAAMGAECEVFYIPTPDGAFQIPDIEAAIAYQGALDGLFIPQDARDYFAAMGFPEHLVLPYLNVQTVGQLAANTLTRVIEDA